MALQATWHAIRVIKDGVRISGLTGVCRVFLGLAGFKSLGVQGWQDGGFMDWAVKLQG